MQPFVPAPGASGPSWRPAARHGLGAAPALTAGLCWAICRWEAKRARSGPRPYQEPLPGSGRIAAGLGAMHDPVRITWLGDSLAAGLGCDDVGDTPAHLTARLLERAVDVHVLAVPGAKARDVIERQLPALEPDSDLIVLCVGANDVASGTRRSRYSEQLDEILAALAPTPTVVLSLPDMAMPDRMAEPLRTLAGARARWFEVARRAVVARHEHVASVDIASRPQGVSRRVGRTMLCADRFHPGPHGYRVWAERIATVAHELLPPLSTPTLAD